MAPIKTKGEYDAIIILYAWENNSVIGAHYFTAISDGYGTYTAYNDSDIKPGKLDTIYSLTKEQGLILGFWCIYF